MAAVKRKLVSQGRNNAVLMENMSGQKYFFYFFLHNGDWTVCTFIYFEGFCLSWGLFYSSSSDEDLAILRLSSSNIQHWRGSKPQCVHSGERSTKCSHCEIAWYFLYRGSGTGIFFDFHKLLGNQLNRCSDHEMLAIENSFCKTLHKCPGCRPIKVVESLLKD